MGAGNSLRFEGGPAAAPVEAVYVEASQSVIDEYNTRLMMHLAAHNLRDLRDLRFGADESAAASDTFPKLVGGKVMVLPVNGGPALPQSEKPPLGYARRSSDRRNYFDNW